MFVKNLVKKLHEMKKKYFLETVFIISSISNASTYKSHVHSTLGLCMHVNNHKHSLKDTEKERSFNYSLTFGHYQ